jgi:SAM-dependent methyltransferase
VQPNSETRRFEYPWAFDRLSQLIGGKNILEIGGGLSGFQWVLARSGYAVTNVDPGLAAKGRGWMVTPNKHRALSRLFRAPVHLIPTVIEDAGLPDRSFDAIVCVSTLEHLTKADIEGVSSVIGRLLKPNGIIVLTVDLFLDVYPFASSRANQWGTNWEIGAFLQDSGLELVEGVRHELYGFPEFDPNDVRTRLGSFLCGAGGTALAQCLVARVRHS